MRDQQVAEEAEEARVRDEEATVEAHRASLSPQARLRFDAAQAKLYRQGAPMLSREEEWEGQMHH